MKTIIGFMMFILICWHAQSAEKNNTVCTGLIGEDYANCQSALEFILRGSSQSGGLSIFATAKNDTWLFSYETPKTFNNKQQCVIIKNHIVLQQGQETRLLYTSQDQIFDLYLDKLDIRKTAVPGRVNEVMINATPHSEEESVESELEDGDASASIVMVDILPPIAYSDWMKKAQKQDCRTIE
jgi:heme/copper-type cytochrome/quinol oxidase subunit 2